jgi:hypothetical protein
LLKLSERKRYIKWIRNLIKFKQHAFAVCKYYFFSPKIYIEFSIITLDEVVVNIVYLSCYTTVTNLCFIVIQLWSHKINILFLEMIFKFVYKVLINRIKKMEILLVYIFMQILVEILIIAYFISYIVWILIYCTVISFRWEIIIFISKCF